MACQLSGMPAWLGAVVKRIEQGKTTLAVAASVPDSTAGMMSLMGCPMAALRCKAVPDSTAGMSLMGCPMAALRCKAVKPHPSAARRSPPFKRRAASCRTQQGDGCLQRPPQHRVRTVLCTPPLPDPACAPLLVHACSHTSSSSRPALTLALQSEWPGPCFEGGTSSVCSPIGSQAGAGMLDKSRMRWYGSRPNLSLLQT